MPKYIQRQFLVSKQYDLPTLYRPNLTLFLKRMRKCFNHKIRYLGCGEYGSKLAHLHYQFISNILRELWPHGHSIGAGFSFKSASYTARYCVKKINKKRLENIIKIEYLSPPACHLSQATIFFDF